MDLEPRPRVRIVSLMTLAERIVLRREELGLTQYRLYKNARLKNQSQLAAIEIGKNKSPGGDILKRIAHALSTSVDALLLDEENPIPAGPDHDAGRPLIEIEVPLVGIAAGGEPIDTEELDDTYPVLRHDFKKGRYVVKLYGDSMYPNIHDGDLFLVEPATKVPDGTIAVVRIGSESTVKRYYKTKDGGSLLRGDNLQFKPMECEPGKAQVIARFVKIVGGKR